MPYYLVRIGTPKHGTEAKGVQAPNPREACKLAFGAITDTMRYRFVAKLKPARVPDWKLSEMMHDERGWKPIPPEANPLLDD